MEKIKQYDTVLMEGGRRGCVVEVFGDQDHFLVDVGSSPEDWETIVVAGDRIISVLKQN